MNRSTTLKGQRASSRPVRNSAHKGATLGRDKATGEKLLERMAHAFGIQTSYKDAGGVTRRASPNALRGLLGLWGIPCDGDALRDALREETIRRERQQMEPVLLAWDGAPTTVQVRVNAQTQLKRMKPELELEDGTRVEVQVRGRAEARIIHGEEVRTLSLRLPRVPLGYHRLSLCTGNQQSSSMIIAAPVRTYQEQGFQPAWGFFVPMYAVRSQRSWGAGDLTDWQRLTTWAHSTGGRMMASLPLLAAFLDKPIVEPSPYSPASRLFWNEFYVDVERVPEFAACDQARKLVRSKSFQSQLQRFRAERFIDYREQYAAKRQVLERLARHFFANVSQRHPHFQKFLAENPRVMDYAQFRAVGDRLGRSWHTWDERLRHGKLQPNDYSEADSRFHAYSQWVAHEQFSALMRQARDTRSLFYLDLPLGVNPDGYDMWREPGSFAQGASVGAPPDMFFTKGQNWGFAPLHPRAIRERHYDYVLEFLRFQMKHAGLLRIDHVMGLHRLWWIPQGVESAVDGAYVSYPAEELYAILSLESHRNKTMLVGENLGTVPPEVNASMERHGVRSMFVLQFEQQPDARKPVRTPPRQTVASINTHDMPSFAAHWMGEDIALRQEMGLLKRKEVGQEKARRVKLANALMQFLTRKKALKPGTSDPGSVVRAALRWLAQSDAQIVLATLEDLWAETQPQNIPGTSVERPNWARKISKSLDEIEADEELRAFCQELTRSRAGV